MEQESPRILRVETTMTKGQVSRKKMKNTVVLLQTLQSPHSAIITPKPIPEADARIIRFKTRSTESQGHPLLEILTKEFFGGGESVEQAL